MIDLLQGYGAKVIGLNILYSEKDANQGLQAIREVTASIEAKPGLQSSASVAGIYATLKAAEKNLDHDAALSTAIGASQRVVLPFFFVLGGPVLMDSASMPEVLARNSVSFASPPDLVTARELIPPVPEFSTPALALGHINLAADSDGAVRNDCLLIDYGGRVFPSLSLQLALKYLGYDLKDLVLGEALTFRRIRIPVHEQGRMLISYSSSYEAYPFVEVLNNRVSPESFRNKIVIIALTATGLGTMQ